MIVANVVHEDTGEYLDTIETSDDVAGHRIAVGGVKYDGVRVFEYGPERTIGVRPVRAP